MRGGILLLVDAILNLALGALLMAFPASLVRLLGVPGAASAFYPSILGAVLFGIGIALFIDWSRPGAGGLGLRGAIAINLCGAAALVAWLTFGGLDLPSRGQVFLWSLVLLLGGLSAVEAAVAVIRGRRQAGGTRENSGQP